MRKLFTLLAVLWGLPTFAQYSISQLPPATTPLTGTEIFPCTQAGTTKKCLTSSVAAGANATFLLQSPNAGLPLSRTLAGTANEILLADGGALGNLVLSTPQAIATTSSPTFSSLILTNPLTVPNGGTGAPTLTGLVLGNGISAMTAYAGTSCTNQFPRSLSAVGAATCATVANTDLANSSITLNGAAIALGGTRTLALASADFVNQGTVNTLLHGNAAGNPTFSAVANADMVNSSVTLNGASLSLGGTRTLALASADFVNQGTTTTVLHGNAAGNPSFGSVTSSDLAAGVFANPSGLIGLTAVNGVATTADRSDATHAIDQSIIPTWTGIHTFSNNVTFTGNGAAPAATTTQVSIRGGSQADVAFINSAAAANNRIWDINVDPTGNLALRAVSDSFAAAALWGTINRTATAITGVTLGNTTDKPAITLNGPVTIPVPASGTALAVNGASASSVLDLNFTNTAQGTSTMRLQNTSATAQSEIDFSSNSVISGRIRDDFLGDMNYVAFSSGSHTFWTAGDAGVGVNRMTLGPGTTVTMPTLVASSAAQTGTVCWSAANLTVDTTVACLASTIRVKEKVERLDVGLREVMRFRPVSYDLKPEFNPFHIPGRQVGLVAEEVQKVDPRLVALDDEGLPRGVRYMQLTAVLVKAVQQQQWEIRGLTGAVIFLAAWCTYLTRKMRNPVLLQAG